MSDSESTIKFAIFSAMVDNTPISNDKFEKVKGDIFERIFEPHMVWAIKEYLLEHPELKD